LPDATFCCRFCRGTGRRKLGPIYAKTLAMLQGQSAPITGAALARLAGCPGSAMANRLVHLERYGLAKGERRLGDGRARYWVATDQSNN
jgi:hypothetical protein